MSINEVTLLGNIGSAPEVRTLESGKKVATVSLATNDYWTDKQSGEKKQDTQWHKITIWSERTIEYIAERFAKGDLVAVRGNLSYNEYEDSNNVKHRSVEVVVSKPGTYVQNYTTKDLNNSSRVEELS